MKPKPLTREQQIFEWKVKGKGLTWARWCHMTGIRVHASAHSRAVDGPRTRPDAQKLTKWHGLYPTTEEGPHNN